MARDRYQGTDAWREERRTGYGASDAPILVEGDEAAWRQLHGEKLGLLPDRVANETMELGHRLEDVIAQIASERMGEPLVRVNRLVRHPELPHVFASLDRRRKRGDRRPVEVKKWAVKGDDWGPNGSDIVPTRILYQVQQQAAVVGADAVDVAVLFGGSRLEIFSVGRDDGIVTELLELETAAWAFVARGEMPPWPGQAPRRITLAADEIALDDPLRQLVALHEAAKDAADRSEAELNDAKDRLRAALADVGGAKGVLEDGRRVSIAHRPQDPLQRTDWKLVASAYRKWFEGLFGDLTPGETLAYIHRAALDPDAIESMFTASSAPARPLRITIGKEPRSNAA